MNYLKLKGYRKRKVDNIGLKLNNANIGHLCITLENFPNKIFNNPYRLNKRNNFCCIFTQVYSINSKINVNTIFFLGFTFHFLCNYVGIYFKIIIFYIWTTDIFEIYITNVRRI